MRSDNTLSRHVSNHINTKNKLYIDNNIVDVTSIIDSDEVLGESKNVSDWYKKDGLSSQSGTPTPTAPISITSNLSAGTYKVQGDDGWYEFTLSEELRGFNGVLDSIEFDKVSHTGFIRRNWGKYYYSSGGASFWNNPANWVSEQRVNVTTSPPRKSGYNSLGYFSHGGVLNTSTGTIGSNVISVFVSNATTYWYPSIQSIGLSGTEDYDTANTKLRQWISANSPYFTYVLANPTRTPLIFTKNNASTATEVPMTFLTNIPSPDYPSPIVNTIKAGKYKFNLNDKSYHVTLQDDLRGAGTAKDRLLFDTKTEMCWVEKKNKSVVFIGDSLFTWSHAYNSSMITNGYLRFSLQLPDMKLQSPSVVSHFTKLTTAEVNGVLPFTKEGYSTEYYQNYLYIVVSKSRIGYLDTDTTSQARDKFKTWLSSNNVYLTYQLETPQMIIQPSYEIISVADSTSLNISKTVNKAIDKMKLYGQSWQNVTTQGANVVDIYKCRTVSRTVDGSFETIQQLGVGSISIRAWSGILFDNSWVVKNLKPSTTYFLKFKVKKTAQPDGYSTNFSHNKGFNLYSGVSGFTSIGKFTPTILNVGQETTFSETFTTPAGLLDPAANYRLLAYSERWLDANSQAQYATCEFSDIIISETNISYTPFIPNSPSPDYPSTIYNTGNCDLVSRGKNYINEITNITFPNTALNATIDKLGNKYTIVGNTSSYPYWGIATLKTSDFKVGTKYTLIYKYSSSGETGVGVRLYQRSPDGAGISFTTYSSGNLYCRQFTMPPFSGTEFYLELACNIGNISVEFSEFQLLEGEYLPATAPKYIPYKTPTKITLPLLGGIKVASTATDYTYIDNNGDKWICDSLEYKGSNIWEYVQRVNTNSMNAYTKSINHLGVTYDNDISTAFYLYCTPDKGYGIYMLSNYFKNQNIVSSSNRTEGMLGNTGGRNFYLRIFNSRLGISQSDDSATKTSKLKAWLDINDMKVYYPLDIPIITQLTLGELKQYFDTTIIEQLYENSPITQAHIETMIKEL